MRLDNVKDIFFVHNERAPLESAVVNRAVQLLAEAGFSIWGYGEKIPWDEDEDEDVNLELLETIFKWTKIVVVINPTKGRSRFSENVLDELHVLRYMRRDVVGHRFILCQINTPEPDPSVTFIDYDGTVQLPFSDEPDDHDIVNLAAHTVIYLLDGAVEWHRESSIGIVGWDLTADISRARLLLEKIQRAGFGTQSSFRVLQRAISKAEEMLD